MIDNIAKGVVMVFDQNQRQVSTGAVYSPIIWNVPSKCRIIYLGTGIIKDEFAVCFLASSQVLLNHQMFSVMIVLSKG